MVIDVHGHYGPKKLDSTFPELFQNASGHPEGLYDMDRQIEDMNKAGIDQRWISVSPYLMHFDAENSSEWCRCVNDAIINDSKPYGDRFRVLGNLPMKHIEETKKELERIMEDPLVVGVQIASNIAGTDLNDDSLETFWQTAEKLGAFILIHPQYQISDQRLSKYYMRNIVGNPLDTTLSAINMMASGVLERYPGLKICLAHGGGYMPFAISRICHGAAVRPELAHVKTPMKDLAKILYYDTVVHDPDCLKFAADQMGVGHMLLGTDYPYDMGVEEPLELLRLTNLPAADIEKIAGDNALGLLK